MCSSNNIPFYLRFSVPFLDSLPMSEIYQLIDRKYIVDMEKDNNGISFLYSFGFYLSRILKSFEKSILNVKKIRLLLEKTQKKPLFTIVAYLSRRHGRKHSFIFSNKIISLLNDFCVDFDFDYYYDIVSIQEEDIESSCSNVDIYIAFKSSKHQYFILKNFYKNNNKLSLLFRNDKIIFKFSFTGIRSIDSLAINQSLLFFEKEITSGKLKEVFHISDINVVVKCELNQYEKVYFDLPDSFWKFLKMYNATLKISLIEPLPSGPNSRL